MDSPAAFARSESLAGIIEDAGRCSTEARQSLWGLRVIDASPQGFPASLAKIARQATTDTSTELVLDIDRVSPGTFGEIEFQLLRIAQEAIANTVRHAAADTLTVSLKSLAQGFALAVADDGDGFDVDRAPFGHFGLMGMPSVPLRSARAFRSPALKVWAPKF